MFMQLDGWFSYLSPLSSSLICEKKKMVFLKERLQLEHYLTFTWANLNALYLLYAVFGVQVNTKVLALS